MSRNNTELRAAAFDAGEDVIDRLQKARACLLDGGKQFDWLSLLSADAEREITELRRALLAAESKQAIDAWTHLVRQFASHLRYDRLTRTYWVSETLLSADRDVYWPIRDILHKARRSDA